jgi:SAM-dependent methyltransferase
VCREDRRAVTEGAGAGPDFDDHVSSYNEAVDSSISFAGADHELYTSIKAQALLDLANRFLGRPEELEAIDVGCGPGETDRLLKGGFGRLVGADVAAGMIEVAARRNPWAEYAAYGEGEPLPFAGSSFDLAFSICVLHHVPPAERAQFAADIARIVRPGGLVAIFEHNPWNPLTRKAVRDCEFDVGVTLASRRRVMRLLSDQGLEVLEAPYIVFFPREGRALRRVERAISRVPLGAQHYVVARKPA